MAKINLLPWREELRAERKKNFLVALGGVVVLAGVALFAADTAMNAAIDHQRDRNAFVQKEINTLNAKIKKIAELKKRKQQMLERMKVIQDLQGNRPVIVRVFDELARAVPDGVYFSRVQYLGGRLQLTGVAESNNRVSDLMRRFDESEWFDEPSLSAVKAVQDPMSEKASGFDMGVKQVMPKRKEAQQ